MLSLIGETEVNSLDFMYNLFHKTIKVVPLKKMFL